MELKAKDASLLAKIIAAFVILGGSALVGIGIIRLSIQDVILIGFSLAGLFGTVDVNLFLEKITGRRSGG